VAVEPRKRLGRGLDALLNPFPGEPYVEPEAAPARRRTVLVASLRRNPRNPRREFRSEELEELAASLKQHGLVQPIVVRPAPGEPECYEIIAGERRWRAAQMAELHEVPVTILDASDREALELAIVENVQRADLNPVEEARGYQALIDEFAYTQNDLGATLGKSRVHVTNTLRLLRLPARVLDLLESGRLSAGHGRALLGARDPEGLAAQIVEKSLSVRETERLAQSGEQQKPSLPIQRPPRRADVEALEKELADALGLRVNLNHDDRNRGELRIRYGSLEQLEDICRKLRR
jgi:ParB family transcriptional regulator, chromosome partitioning protein